MIDLESMNRLMEEALINVGNIMSYCNKWIANYDWLEIIKVAYAIPPTRMLDITILNRAFLIKKKFKLATSKGIPNFIGIFKDIISPRCLPNGKLNNPIQVVHCYQFANPDKPSTSEEEPRRWSNFIE